MRYLMGQDPEQPFYSGASFGTRELNRKTPYGLFISDHSNKYIVTEDFNKKIAIVLQHSKLPQFSWRPLRKDSLDSGNWQGPFWLLATHAALAQGTRMSAGTFEMGDGFAGLDCISRRRKVTSISLGGAGRRGSDFCEYDGWAVHTLMSERPFFVKLPEEYQL